MKKLSRKALKQAETFLQTQARPLEQALFATFLRGASTEWALNELASFQNSDGGFGHGLEPDLQLADSSVLATTVALQQLRDLGVSGDHLLVQGAMRFLLDTYDSEAQAWPIIPSQVDDAPHAPWWQYNPDLSQYLANPRAEIVGYLYDYGAWVPAELGDDLLKSVLNYLEVNAGDLEMHELLCYVRLAESTLLPAETRDLLLKQLRPVIEKSVATDSAALQAYGLKPIWVAAAPSSPFAAMLQEPIAVNLDYELNRQGADGSWAPNWSWGDTYPEAWLHAKRAWQGILTVKTAKTVSDYGRIDGA